MSYAVRLREVEFMARCRIDWRSRFLQVCGPGLLAGIKLEDLLRLLQQEGASVDPSRSLRFLTICTQSLKTSLVARLETRRHQADWERVVLHPPLFVLGHWRSGTTYLHELLTKDPQFGFPNSYQVSFPHTFLTLEKVDTPWMTRFIPRCRPMDAMELSLASPQEEEFALAASTLKSPCLAWVLPSQKQRFEQYLTFADVEPSEVAHWREAFVTFLKKVQLRCKRPLALKSPPHTARVRLLLQVFPGARFIHIHRNPWRVFQSTHRTLQIISRWHGLQKWDFSDLDDFVLRQYVRMYDAFFADRALIPAGHYHEIAFEDLEQDPVGEMRKAYGTLGLPGFELAEPRLHAYVHSIRHYRKTEFTTPLHQELAARIAHRWHRSFDEWGYRALPS